MMCHSVTEKGKVMNKVIILNTITARFNLQLDKNSLTFDIKGMILMLILILLAVTIVLIFQRVLKKFKILTSLDVFIISFILFWIILGILSTIVNYL